MFAKQQREKRQGEEEWMEKCKYKKFQRSVLRYRIYSIIMMIVGWNNIYIYHHA